MKYALSFLILLATGSSIAMQMLVSQRVELLEPIMCSGLESAEFSTLKALLYSFTSCIGSEKRKITHVSVNRIFKEDKDSIMVPTLLLLHAFWQKRNDAVKLAACQFMLRRARSLLVNDYVPAQELMMLIFDELLKQKKQDQLDGNFRIWLKLKRICAQCNAEAEMVESVPVIPLVPQKNMTLEELLQNYFSYKIKPEHVCRGCRISGSTTFKLSINAPPETIVIHLNRLFTFNDNERCNSTICRIPTNHLNVSPFCSYINESKRYYLQAFVAISKKSSKKQLYKTYVRDSEAWICYYKGMPKKVSQQKIDSCLTQSPKTKCFIPAVLFYKQEVFKA